MKKNILLLFVTIVCCCSCTKQEEIISGNELYIEMVNYSSHFFYISEIVDAAKTKSVDVYCDIDNDMNVYESVDINAIDDKFINYIDIYTKPDDIHDWDEHNILDRIALDSNLNKDEKICFARCISAVYFIKNNYGIPLTKSKLDTALMDCREDYLRRTKNAGAEFLILVLAAIVLEPSASGEILAYINYCRNMSQAEKDYMLCVERARRDNPSRPMENNKIIP